MLGHNPIEYTIFHNLYLARSKCKNLNTFYKCRLFTTKRVYLSLISDIMNSKKAILLPKYQKIFDGIGENIKLARKRRKLTTEQVAERAGIHRATLHSVEKGDPTVAIGLYFNVLRVLNLQSDFSKIAIDDEFGRKLQDLDLL